MSLCLIRLRTLAPNLRLMSQRALVGRTTFHCSSHQPSAFLEPKSSLAIMWGCLYLIPWSSHASLAQYYCRTSLLLQLVSCHHRCPWDTHPQENHSWDDTFGCAPSKSIHSSYPHYHQQLDSTSECDIQSWACACRPFGSLISWNSSSCRWICHGWFAGFVWGCKKIGMRK